MTPPLSTFLPCSIEWQRYGVECPLEELLGTPAGDHDSVFPFICFRYLTGVCGLINHDNLMFINLFIITEL